MSSASDATRLADAIRVLLRTFTIDEHRYPAARGRMRYNAVDFQILHYLSVHDTVRAIDIAAHLGAAPTTVQSSLDRLVRSGLIDRRQGSADRRERWLSLTADGRAMQHDIGAQDDANCARMLAVLDEGAGGRLVADIETIARALEAEAQRGDDATQGVSP